MLAVLTGWRGESMQVYPAGAQRRPSEPGLGVGVGGEAIVWEEVSLPYSVVGGDQPGGDLVEGSLPPRSPNFHSARQWSVSFCAWTSCPRQVFGKTLSNSTASTLVHTQSSECSMSTAVWEAVTRQQDRKGMQVRCGDNSWQRGQATTVRSDMVDSPFQSSFIYIYFEVNTMCQALF